MNTTDRDPNIASLTSTPDADVLPDEEPHDSVAEYRATVDAQALALKRNGASHREIARILDIGLSTIPRRVERARAAEPHLDADVVRGDLSAVLDRTIGELTALIADGDTPGDRKIRAVLALVSVVKEKADLHGAHAPIKRQIDVTVVTKEALDAEQIRLERELEAAGVDISRLPSVQQIAELIEATATVNEG